MANKYGFCVLIGLIVSVGYAGSRVDIYKSGDVKEKRTQGAISSFEGGSDPAWIRALAGYVNFQKKYRKKLIKAAVSRNNQQPEIMPEIMIVACSDCDVDPSLLFNSGLSNASTNDFFIVRNVANIIPVYAKNNTYGGTTYNTAYGNAHHAIYPNNTYTNTHNNTYTIIIILVLTHHNPRTSTYTTCASIGAALEYGVNKLRVKHLIILGHSNCQGVRGSVQGIGMSNEFITPWVSQIKKTECTDQYGNYVCRHVQESVGKQSMSKNNGNRVTGFAVGAFSPYGGATPGVFSPEFAEEFCPGAFNDVACISRRDFERY